MAVKRLKLTFSKQKKVVLRGNFGKHDMHGISSKFFAYFQGISSNSVGPDIQQLAGIPGIPRNVNFVSVEQNANKKQVP